MGLRESRKPDTSAYEGPASQALRPTEALQAKEKKRQPLEDASRRRFFKRRLYRSIHISWKGPHEAHASSAQDQATGTKPKNPCSTVGKMVSLFLSQAHHGRHFLLRSPPKKPFQGVRNVFSFRGKEPKVLSLDSHDRFAPSNRSV